MNPEHIKVGGKYTCSDPNVEFIECVNALRPSTGYAWLMQAHLKSGEAERWWFAVEGFFWNDKRDDHRNLTGIYTEPVEQADAVDWKARAESAESLATSLEQRVRDERAAKESAERERDSLAARVKELEDQIAACEVGVPAVIRHAERTILWQAHRLAQLEQEASR